MNTSTNKIHIFSFQHTVYYCNVKIVVQESAREKELSPYYRYCTGYFFVVFVATYPLRKLIKGPNRLQYTAISDALPMK